MTIISAILTNIILNQEYQFYHDEHIELTLRDVIDFILSPNGGLFITVWALIAGSHYVVAPIVMNAMSYIARGAFISGGNLFFYFIYFILTRILRLKSEKKFSFIRENELMNYLLYLLHVCHFKNGRTVQNQCFRQYKWYVVNITNPFLATAHNVNLTTAVLISTWAVIHQYNFHEVTPIIYSMVAFVSLCYIANAITVLWIVNKSEYFLGVVTNSINYFDSLKLQRDSKL